MRHTRAALRRTTATLEDSSSHVRSWGSRRPFGSYLIYNIQLGWSQHINAFWGRTMKKSLSIVLLFVVSALTTQECRSRCPRRRAGPARRAPRSPQDSLLSPARLDGAQETGTRLITRYVASTRRLSPGQTASTTYSPSSSAPLGAVPSSNPFSPFSPLTLAPHGTIFAESLDGTHSEPAADCAHHEDPGDLPFHGHANDTRPARPDHAARGA